MKKSHLIPILFSCATYSISFAQINVVPVTDPVQAAASFVFDGVSVTNVVYTGDENAFGSFSNATGIVPGLESGLVLSTGSINPEGSAPVGAPVSSFANTINDAPGHYLLNCLISSDTYDAAVFEFDLVPIGNILEFQYVFASEEYPEFAGSSFNDVFGFFICGPNPNGGNYNNVNIAIIPGTTSPVAINNVNGNVNSSFYIDNEALNNPDFVFDGSTVLLTAQINVIAGNTYHLVMAIADVGDMCYDSAIFLKASSMKSYIFSGEQNPATIKPMVFYDAVSKTICIQYVDGGPIQLQLFNLQGAMVLSGMNESLSTEGLKKGVYLAKISFGENVAVEKILID
ncbi:MAG TPA: choice-of-anchor L domain-containing protein [Bacteroidales bacterium]|nr:choice-of-anchor L domain-containing protein [Bacteroidales bacterium]HQP04922.1 choice-of-anchor L domain-containing protein [Bacteroidales bacterium]